MIIEVTLSELRDAASKISKENQNFRDSVAALMTATNDLAEGWEGEAHEDFVSTMQDRQQWYEKMMDLVDEYVKSMNEAAQQYEELDQQGVATIRKL